MTTNPLFSLESVRNSTSETINRTRSKSKVTTEKALAKIAKAGQTVKEVFGKLEMGKTIHYSSICEFSMHDLLFHILEQTGPAEVCFSTWSVSENAVRMIIDGMQSGKITKLKCLLDWRVRVRTPNSYEMLKYNIADIRLTGCHAKVTVIENEKWKIAIVTRSTYINNPRIEAGVICCDPVAAAFHKDWITAEMREAHPFETLRKGKNG